MSGQPLSDDSHNGSLHGKMNKNIKNIFKIKN